MVLTCSINQTVSRSISLEMFPFCNSENVKSEKCIGRDKEPGAKVLHYSYKDVGLLKL